MKGPGEVPTSEKKAFLKSEHVNFEITSRRSVNNRRRKVLPEKEICLLIYPIIQGTQPTTIDNSSSSLATVSK